MRLKTSTTTLAKTSDATSSTPRETEPTVLNVAASSRPSQPSRPTPIATPTAITSSVAAGPAAATRNSEPAVAGSERMCIRPPNRNRSMPATSIPSRRATSACPISWTMIDPKNRNAAATAVRYTVVVVASTVSRKLSWKKKITRNRTSSHE